VTDREIDEILKHAAQAPHDVDPVLLDRVTRSIKSSLRPVRPLPAPWVLTDGLVLICAAVALAGAARSGLYGIEKLSVLERTLIFPALGILIWLAATAFVSEMIPGSRRRLNPGALLGVGSLVLLAIFAVLFRDYRTDRFVSQGVICLAVGLLYAIPTALASWLLLRRGFAVNPVAAGLVVGTLGGLAGVTMLELHCANFQALHVMLWHTAVMLISGAAGALLAWAASFRTDSGVHERSAPE
jgi:hypothetical protein